MTTSVMWRPEVWHPKKQMWGRYGYTYPDEQRQSAEKMLDIGRKGGYTMRLVKITTTEEIVSEEATTNKGGEEDGPEKENARVSFA